jgi:hypothetical protein
MTGDRDGETEADGELVEEMVAARSLPAAGFRGALSRHLAAEDPGYGPRPRHLRPWATGFLLSSMLIMLLALAQATGNL